ncbi:MAG: efflux RND transporter periplasmic adaptor subunit [Victivallales bacterium]
MKLSSVFAAVGGVVLAVAVSSCREVEKKTAPPPSVVVEEAAEFDFADSCTEVGTVAAFDSVDLVANVSGFLTEVNFKEGALVKKGEKLFQIDPAVYDAAVKKATADLRKAHADLKNAEIEYDRQKQLLRKDATAKRNYDLAEMNKMTAAADVLAAEAGLEQAKVNLSYTQVLAPFDGWISFKKYSAGNMVGPTSGVLATVVRNGDVKIYFSISEMDMLRLLRSYPGADRDADKKGPEVEIDFQDGVKYEYPGRISAWNNAISDGTGTFRLQAVAKNPDRKLFPGMYVRVKIRVEPYSRQIMIRNEAIMREQLGNFVFVVNKDNKIERRKVTLGGKNGGYYAVREGLKKGERIVIAGLQKAQPGSIVTPIANREQAPDGSATPVANAK